MRECRSLPAVVLAIAACIAPAGTTRPPAGSTETISIRVHEGTTLALDLSPDGRAIVMDLLGQLWQLPAAGGDARALTSAVQDTAEDLDPSWSPRGGRIVFRGERNGRTGLWLTDTSGAAPRQLTQLENPEGFDGNAAWSPDGNAIAFARMLPPRDSATRWRSGIELLDVATGAIRELPALGDSVPDARDPAWEPGGARLAVVAARSKGTTGGPIWLVDVGSGRAARLASSPARALAPAFAPDGRTLAFFAPDSAERMQLWVAAAAGNDAPRRLTSHADVTPTRARWTPDGRSLVYSADGRLWRVPAAGGAPAEIPFTVALSFTRPRRNLPPPVFPEPGRPQHVRAFMGLALSPDAKTVAMLALAKLWVMPVGGAARAVAEVPAEAHHLAWSPDGRTLAWSAGRWYEEDLWATDVATGATRRLTALPGREEHPAYSADGRELLFLHQADEDHEMIRIVSAGDSNVTDARKTRAVTAEPGAEASWVGPDVLYLTGGFSAGESTRVELVRRSGARRPLGRLDSPLYLQPAAGAVIWLRHARLWRAPLDSAGLGGPPEPLGEDPAMYPSVARDGSVLYVSEGGLRLRSPDGRVRQLGWPISYTPPVAPPLLLRNARIIDGTGAPATPPRDILIERGRISRIAEAGTIAPGGARVVDVAGKWVMPGLIDLHAHVYRPQMFPGYAYFGVTTVRDQGSPVGPLVAYADMIAAGKVEGPRVDYGGIQFYTDWGFDLEDGQGVEPPADSGHVARSVAVAHAIGSAHIKTRTFRRWDLNARMITEAHRLGMRVTGHCSHPLPLVAAGMDAKEHSGFCAPRGDGVIYDDLIQLFKAAGIGVVPTISYSAFAVQMKEHPEMLYADGEVVPFLPERNAFRWMERLDSSGLREYQGYVQQARAATLKWARAGLTMGTGTDIWQVPTAVHMELEEMVKAGMTPLEAIRAGTLGSAEVIGSEGELGTIEQNKRADLVLLDADPFADIRNTRRIGAVVQSGRLVARERILDSTRIN